MDCDIVKLAELLRPKKPDESDSEDDLDNRDGTTPGPTPADIGGRKERKQSVYAKIDSEERKPSNVDPDNEEALYFSPEETAAQSDWKKTPQWDVSYKQQVTPSDVFLQMSGKTLATASCEDMILKIHLPEEDHRNIDLKVFKDNIKLVSPKFRLEMPLSHPVDPQRGNAQWNQDTEQLIVTLRMEREFDYINF